MPEIGGKKLLGNYTGAYLFQNMFFWRFINFQICLQNKSEI